MIKQDKKSLLKYINDKAQTEFENIYNSLKVKKDIAFGRIYIDIDDICNNDSSWIPYQYMFWLNILWDPKWKYYISEDIYNNLAFARMKLKKNFEFRQEWEAHINRLFP